jgi:hypothetical protein
VLRPEIDRVILDDFFAGGGGEIGLLGHGATYSTCAPSC